MTARIVGDDGRRERLRTCEGLARHLRHDWCHAWTHHASGAGVFGGLVESRSGGAAFVVMLHAADVRDFDNRSSVGRLNAPRHWGILVERQVGPEPMIVGAVETDAEGRPAGAEGPGSPRGGRRGT